MFKHSSKIIGKNKIDLGIIFYFFSQRRFMRGSGSPDSRFRLRRHFKISDRASVLQFCQSDISLRVRQHPLQNPVSELISQTLIQGEISSVLLLILIPVISIY